MNTYTAMQMMNAIMAASLIGFAVGCVVTGYIWSQRRPRLPRPEFPWDDDLGDDGPGSWGGEAAEMKDLHGAELHDALAMLRNIQEEDDRPKQYVVRPLDE